MKRKIVASLLSAMLVVGALAGCGAASDSAGGKASTAEATKDGESTKDAGSTKETGSAGGKATAETGAEETNVPDVNEDGTVNNPEAVAVDANKLVLWSLFSGGDGSYMDKIIADFNASSPTKEVQSIMLVWGDYYTKLQTAVAVGKGPDAGISHASKLPELVDQGVVQSLSPYLEQMGVDLSTSYAANSIDSVTFDGEVYGIPLDTHAEIIYFNKDIIAKAGIELNADGLLDINGKDEFLAMCDQIKAVLADGASVISFPSSGDDPYRVWWATYFQMGGAPLINDDGTEVTLDMDIALEAANFVKSLYDNGYILEGISNHQQFFQSGTAAFYIGGTWGTGALEQTEALNFAGQPFPQLFGDASCWADSHVMILPANPERTEEETLATVEFLYSASKDGGAIWAGSGQIPSNTEVLASDEYAALPYRSSYKAALETAVLPSKNANFYAMKAGIIESLDLLWTNTADAQTAIESVYAALEDNLQ